MKEFFLSKFKTLFSLVKKVKLKKLINKRMGVFLLLLLVFGLILSFGLAQTVHAEEAQQSIGDLFYNKLVQWQSEIFLGVGQFCIKLAIFALKFFIALAQYNDYLDAPTVAIGWIMVRDLANMFFVVVLLAIAFGTIMGSESYMWNKTLVKFVLAAVFINFSNLICGIFIDVAHVFTITFVNAIAATADGNLINMFQMAEVYKMVNQTPDVQSSNLGLGVMIASLASFIFALLTLLAMGSYVVIMLVRVIALWVLIVLSPLAFILSIIPQTESYAKQWWEYFGKYVMVAPLIVFFLWLSFATAGSGNIAGDIGITVSDQNLAQMSLDKTNVETSISLSAVTKYSNMANFFIPFALMIIGITIVQKTGTIGSGLLGGALDFGKKVAMIASGYATGRKLVEGGAGKGKELAEKAGLNVLKNMPLGGEFWARQGMRLSDMRKYSPIVSRIPFIGGRREIANKKMRERLEKISKMKEYVANKNINKGEGPLTYALAAAVGTPITMAIGKGLSKLGGLDEALGIDTWKEKGGVGFSANTAARDFWERAELQTKLRSDENRKGRVSLSTLNGYLGGAMRIKLEEDKQLDQWEAGQNLYSPAINAINTDSVTRERYEESLKGDAERDLMTEDLQGYMGMTQSQKDTEIAKRVAIWTSDIPKGQADLRIAAEQELAHEKKGWELMSDSEKQVEIDRRTRKLSDNGKSAELKKKDFARRMVMEDEDLRNNFFASKQGQELEKTKMGINKATGWSGLLPSATQMMGRNMAAYLLHSERTSSFQKMTDAVRDSVKYTVLSGGSEASGIAAINAYAKLTGESGKKLEESLVSSKETELYVAGTARLKDAQTKGPEAVAELIASDPIARDIHLNHKANEATEAAKRAKSDAVAAYSQTGVGEDILQKIEESKIGTKVGEDIVKEIQQAKIKAQFVEARSELDRLSGDYSKYKDATDEGGKAKFAEVLLAYQKLLKDNVFASAIKKGGDAEAAEKDATAARDLASKSHADVRDMVYDQERRELDEKYAGIAKDQGAPLTAEQQKAKDKEMDEIQTSRMRAASATVASQAVQSYLSTVTKNDVRYEEAADALEKSAKDIEEKEAAVAELEDFEKVFAGKNTDEVAREIAAEEAEIKIAEAKVLTDQATLETQEFKANEEASAKIDKEDVPALEKDYEAYFAEEEEVLNELEPEEKALKEEGEKLKQTLKKAKRDIVSAKSKIDKDEKNKKITPEEATQAREELDRKSAEIQAQEDAYNGKAANYNTKKDTKMDGLAEKKKVLDDRKDGILKRKTELVEKIDAVRAPVVQLQAETAKRRSAIDKRKELFNKFSSAGAEEREKEKEKRKAELATAKKKREDYLDSDVYASDIYYTQLKAEDDAREKSQKARLANSFWGTQKALSSLDKQIAAEMTDLADNALKKLKSTRVQEKFAKVKEAVQQAAEGKGDLTLEQLVQVNPIVRATVLARQGKDDDLMRQLEEEKFNNEVSSKIVDPSLRGFGVSSGVVDKFLEQYKRQLDYMGEGERGERGSDNLLMLAGMNAKGKRANAKESLFAAASYESAQFNGNVDDLLSALAGKMNILEQYEKYGNDKDRMEKGKLTKDQVDAVGGDLAGWQKLRDLAVRFNWAEKIKKDGKDMWIDKADAVASGTLELYMNTGGDEELVDRAYSINRIVDAKGLDFKDASAEYFEQNKGKLRAGKASGEVEIADYNDLLARYDKYQDLFRSVSEARKERSKQTGHTQLGFNMMFDSDSGKVRLLSLREHKAAKAGTVSKDANTKANPQGFGRYDNMNARQVYVDADMMRIHKLGSSKTVTDFQRMADDRVRRVVYLGTHRKAKVKTTKTGHAVLGDSKEYLTDRGFGDELLGAYDQLFNVIGPALVGGGTNMAMAAAIETNQERIDSEAGIAKMTYASHEEELRSNGTGQFSGKIKSFLGSKRELVITSLKKKIASEKDFNQRMQMIEKMRLFAGKTQRDEVLEDLKAQAKAETDKAMKTRMEEEIMFFEAETGENSKAFDKIVKELGDTSKSFEISERTYIQNRTGNRQQAENDPSLEDAA